MELIRQLLREHLLGGIALLLFLPVSAISVLALAWPVDREVLWYGDWVFSQCGLKSAPVAGNCVAQYELAIGNSGSTEERVDVDWDVDLRAWTLDHRVLDLSGDRARAHDPVLDCRREAERMQCSLDRFAAGTLVIIRLRCLLCARNTLRHVGDSPPRLLSTARVHRSDPRATLLFRRLGVLLSLV